MLPPLLRRPWVARGISPYKVSSLNQILSYKKKPVLNFPKIASLFSKGRLPKSDRCGRTRSSFPPVSRKLAPPLLETPPSSVLHLCIA